MLTIAEISNAVALVADEYGIKRIMLFGSYADGSNTDESDVDLLVEFNSEAVSLLTLAAVKNRIEELLNVDVDVIHAPIEENSLIKPGKAVEIYAA